MVIRISGFFVLCVNFFRFVVLFTLSGWFLGLRGSLWTRLMGEPSVGSSLRVRFRDDSHRHAGGLHNGHDHHVWYTRAHSAGGGRELIQRTRGDPYRTLQQNNQQIGWEPGRVWLLLRVVQEANHGTAKQSHREGKRYSSFLWMQIHDHDKRLETEQLSNIATFFKYYDFLSSFSRIGW